MSTTPDPSMPVVAHEWDTPLPNGTWRGHLTYERPTSGAGYKYRDALIRQRDAEAALAALRERLEGAEKLLGESRTAVQYAAARYYDGTNGYLKRAAEAQLLAAIDAHLAASKGASA